METVHYFIEPNHTGKQWHVMGIFNNNGRGSIRVVSKHRQYVLAKLKLAKLEQEQKSGK